MYEELTLLELAALSARFRSARQACRKRMHANWWNAEVTESYRGMVVDFQRDDPLFDDATRRSEVADEVARKSR